MQRLPSRHKIWLGRARETAELEAGLDELQAGRGGLFLITGEPGIGKTRLADEVARLATARGVPVHWGRAWEAGGAPAYWPIVQALRTMAPGAPVLDALVTPSATSIERFQLFEAVDTFLRAAAPPPRLMVLDDLHASDPSSLHLLHFIVRDLRSRPIMVIGTYRDAEARLAAELRPLLAHVAREACVLRLGPLDRGEVAQFVAAAEGSDPARDRVDELYAQTEGNPLFLREVLQLSGAEARRSEGIREVVRARLALIPSASRAALEAAAVLGREFAALPLAAVAGVSELEARALIEPAAHAGVVESLREPPRWRFTHVLLRQGLYDDLSVERRAALHRAAAEELRRRTDGTPLAELAHHLAHAIPTVSHVEAARAAMDAADHAMRLLAYEDALAFYESAERLLGELAGEERSLAEAVLGAGLALMRMAEVDRGKEACGRAAELARRLDDGELFARAVLGGGYEHAPWVRDLAGIARLEEALAMLPPGDGALRARCMAQLAGDRQPEPAMSPLVELAREAVAMARRCGDMDTLRATLSAAGFAMALYADPAERKLINQEAVRLALAAGDKRVALRAHGFLVGDLWELGDMVGARPHAVAVESLVREFRHGRFQWLASILRAMESLFEGRFEEAERRYREAEASLSQDEARGSLLLAAPISIACVTEQYEDAAALESKARAAFGSMGHGLSGCIGEMVIARLHGRAGDRQRAEAQLETVHAHPSFGAIEEAPWLATLTDACHLARDAKLADRLYRALLPRARHISWIGPLGACVDLPYARHLGLLAETLSRVDDAVAHLEDADALASRAGMRAHFARLRYERARSLLARGGDGDRDRAAGLIAEARELATEFGQTGLLPRIAALTVDDDPRPAPVATGGGGRFSLHREGDYWCVEWQTRTVRLRDSRGLSLLARLVDSPGQELHVLQLASPGAEHADASDAGPALDSRAVQDYRRRLLELREDLDEAERFADTARAGKAREEMDFLTGELARAVGLGGRSRRTGHAAERARTAVQKRLREAVRRIEDELPELGRHLDHTIHTGVFCAYLPDGRRR
jgi:hypothetical protein